MVRKPAARPVKRPAKRTAKLKASPGAIRIGPSKEVVRLSEELESLLLQDQRKQKAPKGMEKCPLCGVILEPTKTRRVRTHDNSVTGQRCEASKEAQTKNSPKR